jgi:CDP-glycerol glycerophosphotransferase (TagB/SpsB family)
LPFPYSFNIVNLIDNILKYNKNEYIDRLNVFFEKMNLFEDGKASERIVNRIVKEMKL